MSTVAAVSAAVLGGLAVLQVLVAAGLPLGRLVWGGQHEVLPRRFRVGSALSVPFYAAIAVVLLWRAGTWGTPPPAAGVTTWVVVGYLAIGIVLNAISRSRPERLVMTPVCMVLTACAAVVATG